MEKNKQKTIIIITGMPGTGKTFLAKRLLEDFPFFKIFSYDDVKERLWDKYGFENEEEKKKINDCALSKFYQQLEEYMNNGISLIIEYPFNQKHKPQILKLVDENCYKALTILLRGDIHAIYQRMIKRDKEQLRHIGHTVNAYHKGVTDEPAFELSEEDFAKDISKKSYDIQIGKSIYLDVTLADELDYTAIKEAIINLETD